MLPARLTTRVLTLGLVAMLSCFLPLGTADVEAVEPDSNRHREVIYGRKHGMALTLDVLRPKQPNGRGVLWIVSGRDPSHKKIHTRSFRDRVGPLLDANYTVFAVRHSNGPRFGLQDQVQDVRRAIRFVRHKAEEFGVDGKKIGVAGSSYGGYLALMVATTGDSGNPEAEDPVERESSVVQAAGCFFPPTDWVNFGGEGVSIVDVMKNLGQVDPSFVFYRKDKKTGEYIAIRARSEILRILGEHSPLQHVSDGDAPTLIIHGDRDKPVPIQQSVRMVSAMKKKGIPSKLVTRKGKGHAWKGWEKDSTLIAEWLDMYVGGK